jgi:hypothetical protein
MEVTSRTRNANTLKGREELNTTQKSSDVVRAE